MNKIKVWVGKDKEGGILRPFSAMWQREERLADYVQPDIDKWLEKMKGECEVVKAEIVEVTD